MFNTRQEGAFLAIEERYGKSKSDQCEAIIVVLLGKYLVFRCIRIYITIVVCNWGGGGGGL